MYVNVECRVACIGIGCNLLHWEAVSEWFFSSIILSQVLINPYFIMMLSKEQYGRCRPLEFYCEVHVHLLINLALWSKMVKCGFIYEEHTWKCETSVYRFCGCLV